MFIDKLACFQTLHGKSALIYDPNVRSTLESGWKIDKCFDASEQIFANHKKKDKYYCLFFDKYIRLSLKYNFTLKFITNAGGYSNDANIRSRINYVERTHSMPSEFRKVSVFSFSYVMQLDPPRYYLAYCEPTASLKLQGNFDLLLQPLDTWAWIFIALSFFVVPIIIKQIPIIRSTMQMNLLQRVNLVPTTLIHMYTLLFRQGLEASYTRYIIIYSIVAFILGSIYETFLTTDAIIKPTPKVFNDIEELFNHG